MRGAAVGLTLGLGCCDPRNASRFVIGVLLCSALCPAPPCGPPRPAVAMAVMTASPSAELLAAGHPYEGTPMRAPLPSPRGTLPPPPQVPVASSDPHTFK